MKKRLSNFFNLFSEKKSNTVENIKITSDINGFKIRELEWKPIQRQGDNPRVNWFYLIDEDRGRIRCFSKEEATKVNDFLNNAIHTGFGNCFINIQNSNCVNNECEKEVQKGIRENNSNKQFPKPNRILPRNFGENPISNYTLSFKIIGYFY